jgi:hypothetical protein
MLVTVQANKDELWSNPHGEQISTGAVKVVSTYEEVIVSCSGHDAFIESVGAAASKRTGWDP